MRSPFFPNSVPSKSLVVVAFATIATFASVVACGPKPASKAATSANAGEGAGASSAHADDPAPPAPPLSSSPPAKMPAPIEAKSNKTDKKHDAAWAACHKDYKAEGKSLEADVTKLAKGCAEITKMKQLGKTLTGKQDAEGKPDAFPLKALAGKCYRVYAESSNGIQDLDMAIKDSAGDIAGEDSTDDSSPVVLEDGAVCFKVDDSAQIIVAVGAGKGSYALQVWSD